LRAGKAVEQTGQLPTLDRNSDSPNSPGQDAETKPSPARATPSRIPQILFEGDEPDVRAGKAVTQKFELGDSSRIESLQKHDAKLPESYGTGRLLLTARDTQTLYAHWDLTNEQQRHYNALSVNGTLAVRAYAHAHSNQPVVEVPAQPDSRHLFLRVQHPGTSYVSELGYYQPSQQWITVATSGPATTPPDAPSKETTVVFSTPQAPKTIQPATQNQNQPSVIPVSAPRCPFEAEEPVESGKVSELGPRAHESLPEDAPPFVKRGPRKEWSPVRERLLAEMIRISSERREWISSAETVRLIDHGIEMPTDLAWSVLPAGIINISSPAGEEQQARKGFWFNVNAELIIYGATEPNAQVAIAGRPIKLRPDGTFSCHFALPDGGYALAATAVSSENELRQATFNFSRQTEYSGEVGAHPQDPSLERLPQPE
jgi:hypothetical protein